MTTQILFDISKYLSEEQITEICTQEIRAIINDKLQKDNDFTQILSNVAYNITFDIVNESLDGNLTNIIKEKTLSIIENMSSFTVFREATSYGDKESVATSIINDTVKDNIGLINKKVVDILGQTNKKDLIPIINKLLTSIPRGN